MAFINQGRHIGTVGLKPAFSVESSEGGCVNYTDGGTDYTACTFTTSGILTITGTGNVDAMIISGGGGAGSHGPANSEGGWFGGGGGAGGMLVTTNTEMVAGTYTVEVGAGGTGTGSPNAARMGNLSWITPQRVLTISNLSNAAGFVVGETLTGGTSDATADVISHSPSTTVAASHDIQLQGNIPGPGGSNPEQIPYHGSGASVVIETTLTDLPNFQVGETITGSTNSYTATVGSVALSGISELATSVGGGGGSPAGQTGYGGGSGGGGGSNNIMTTPTSLNVAGQGNRGGGGGDRNAFSGAGGGGGGAGAAGNSGSGNSGGTGGNGLANFYRDGNTSGTTIGTHIFAGGGGSAGGNQAPGVTAGGSGGGGTGTSGAVNSGGGGGTGASPSHGGSGIVVVRFNRNQ